LKQKGGDAKSGTWVRCGYNKQTLVIFSRLWGVGGVCLVWHTHTPPARGKLLLGVTPAVANTTYACAMPACYCARRP